MTQRAIFATTRLISSVSITSRTRGAFVVATYLCLALFSCSQKSESSTQGTSPKFEQYFVQGEKLYTQNCSNCHQKNGTGLGLVYPPLNRSDYMENNFTDVICIIKNGKKGELVVNGKIYNQAMPGIPSLTDLEVAEIATYIYNSWENHLGIVEVNNVSKILSSCDSVPVTR